MWVIQNYYWRFPMEVGKLFGEPLETWDEKKICFRLWTGRQAVPVWVILFYAWRFPIEVGKFFVDPSRCNMEKLYFVDSAELLGLSQYGPFCFTLGGSQGRWDSFFVDPSRPNTKKDHFLTLEGSSGRPSNIVRSCPLLKAPRMTSGD